MTDGSTLVLRQETIEPAAVGVGDTVRVQAPVRGFGAAQGQGEAPHGAAPLAAQVTVVAPGT
jgi:hypothetical protein